MLLHCHRSVHVMNAELSAKRLPVLRASQPIWTVSLPVGCHLLLSLSPKDDTHFAVPQRVEGWVQVGYMPRWLTRPQTVTHPSTNRARRRATTFVKTSWRVTVKPGHHTVEAMFDVITIKIGRVCKNILQVPTEEALAAVECVNKPDNGLQELLGQVLYRLEKCCECCDQCSDYLWMSLTDRHCSEVYLPVQLFPVE